MRRGLAVLLLLLAVVCGYGFLATFEPGPSALKFRAGYSGVGLFCLLGIVALLRRK